MRAMILAAGRGSRFGQLTKRQPKAMLEVAGEPLIARTLRALKRSDINNAVINISYLGDAIVNYVGDGSHFGVSVCYSREKQALETAGGVIKALPLLGETFLVLNVDIIHDFPLERLLLHKGTLATLVMVPNPAHHPEGDFSFSSNFLTPPEGSTQTFAGIGVYHTDFFAKFKAERERKLPLKPLFEEAISTKQLRGVYHKGLWIDVGNKERLLQAESMLANSRV